MITIVFLVMLLLLALLVNGMSAKNKLEKPKKVIKETKKVIKETKKKKIITKQSSSFKKIWSKKDSELIKLADFLLNMPKGEKNFNEVVRHKSKPDNSNSGYDFADSKPYIVIRDKRTDFGIKISKESHRKIDIHGLKPFMDYRFRPNYQHCYDSSKYGTVFFLKEKKREDWFLKNLNKSDFGISKYK